MLELANSLKTAFIDKSIISNKELMPRFIYNDHKNNIKLSTEISSLLKECDTFDISVAFISTSGLSALKQLLLELKRINKRGRIITSTYLGFNSPKVFEELLTFNNLDVRLYEDEVGFHPKGYIFKKDDYYKAIIGSTNLTQTALSENQEWNIVFTSYKDGEIIHQINNEFEKQWMLSNPLTKEWIEEYKQVYVAPSRAPKLTNKKNIEPNYMQRNALDSLSSLRNNGKDKALLVSATGTGKTYLSAFDVKAYNPKKMLFVVHRRSIAIKAMETFQTIIKNKSMGLFSGSLKELDKDYIFSTVQTISKPEYREMFSKTEFDYIIIDEVHKAGANSYQELVKYFKPEFLLGMSATPERSDNFDIYKMFDYNIAFEIRLQQAMEYNLLCPFHYYGITDLVIDNKVIDEKTDFNLLTSDIRVDYIIDKINDYGFSGEKVHGLIFVSRKEEAKELSKLFNSRGYKTVALTGEDSEKKRQEAMDRLESNDEDAIDYIITVDIFNEGIDIPKVNQVVMLRPTQSAIIFVQQLGRGLRKNSEKEYVVIIDFIGNYEKNFLIPIALSGNTNLNKDTLRKFVFEGSTIIPGSSTIQFDEISRKRIFESIDAANFNDIKMIKESYFNLKAKLGRIPNLSDFDKYGAIDVQRIFQNKSLGSYHEFLKKYEKDYKVKFSSLEEMYLKFISIKLSSGKRIQELEAIKLLINKKNNLKQYLTDQMLNNYNISLEKVSYETIYNVLSQNFATGSSKDTFKDVVFVDDNWNISQEFNNLLNSNEFSKQVNELLDYSIDLYNREYNNRYLDTDLCLYKKYTYEDVCRLLNWDKSLVSLNIGGYYYDERTNTLPVFINYEKEDDISETTKYHDRFIDQNMLVGMSKSKRKIDSQDIQKFRNADINNTLIHIFVRKNKDDKISKEFYYLGKANIGNIKQVTMGNNIDVCEIEYILDQTVRKDVYDYIVN